MCVGGFAFAVIECFPVNWFRYCSVAQAVAKQAMQSILQIVYGVQFSSCVPGSSLTQALVQPFHR